MAFTALLLVGLHVAGCSDGESELVDAAPPEDNYRMVVDAYAPVIYGNANGDNRIDHLDVDYVKGVIEGINELTELSDANYDGKIDEADILQIKRIISGTQTELTLQDMDGRPVTRSRNQ